MQISAHLRDWPFKINSPISNILKPFEDKPHACSRESQHEVYGIVAAILNPHIIVAVKKR